MYSAISVVISIVLAVSLALAAAYYRDENSVSSAALTSQQGRSPTLSGIYPDTGSPGDAITLVGGGLVAVAEITINGTPVQVTDKSSGNMNQIIVPQLPAGSYSITVSVPGYPVYVSAGKLTVR